MNKSEETKVTMNGWMTFIVLVIVVLGCGFWWGLSVGRDHPSSTAKYEYIEEVWSEMHALQNTYIDIVEEYEIQQQIQDSIISALESQISESQSDSCKR